MQFYNALAPKIQSCDISYGKFKILFINVFTILYKATTLCPFKLGNDLKLVQNVLGKSCCNTILAQLFILFVTLVIFAKFLFSYLGLAANIIALFPILVEDAPDLLLPSIFSQIIENILFCVLDILIGGITVRYFIPCKRPLLVIFAIKNIIKLTVCISALNTYIDLYNNLKDRVDDNESIALLQPMVESELFLRKESLV
ncbi:uncharacterized protein LOC118740423 [Rhagoletis pomonella]|uniref:uncharacterized protein LOC118740423 n=1 Tax=Rhagoletis pomonella TaxID=28610 RepID=UPI00177E4BD6|nr:uncharacterized protein LOC118740423 [Rhagoletis pomonella]